MLNNDYFLSDFSSDDLISKGVVYPTFTQIREISARIAFVTNHQIAQEQNTTKFTLEDIKAKMWTPGYHPLKKSI